MEGDIEANLRKALPDGELERRVAGKIESFHGFLTRDAAMRLVAKEEGLLKSEERACRLADIKKGERKVAFRASVRKVWPVAEYSSGKKSRVVEVQDETGRKPLVLWNEDVALASRLRAQDAVSVRGAYEKNGELHLGYSGSVEVTDKAAFTDLGGIGAAGGGGPVHVRGFVSRVEGYDGFVQGARTMQGFSFFVSDGTHERRCVLLGGIGRASGIRPEDEVIIENAAVGASGNIEIGEESRMLSRRPKEMLLGEVAALECHENDALTVRVGGREARLERESALKFLGVRAAPDIALSTVVDLKKGSLLNTRIAVRIEEKDGRTIVR
jgi:hypothetical protein